MHLKKEVYERCRLMVEHELSTIKYKLRDNKYTINKLAKEQRILKGEIGKLYETLKLFQIKEEI